MTAWIDIEHLNTALLLAALTFVAHWIIRVTKSLSALEHLRFEVFAKMALIQAAIDEADALNEQIHVDIARRLERLESWPIAGEPRH